MIHTHILRVCYVCVHEIQQLNPTRIALWLLCDEIQHLWEVTCLNTDESTVEFSNK